MTLEEMESNLKGSLAASEAVPDGEFEDQVDEDEQAYMDLQEALKLLKKTKILLDYYGDSDMVRTIAKKDRDTINRVSGKVTGYLDNVYAQYMEDEQESEE